MIHGLTYEVGSDGSLPRLGILRKGGPKIVKKRADGSEYEVVGRDLGERLRFAGADDDIQADWIAMFESDMVEELDVILPYATVDECWQAWRESYTAGGLKIRCDGRNHVLWQRDDGTYSTDPTPCPGASCDCKPVGRLEVIVPAFERLGVITVTTTSLNDIRAIDGAIRSMAVRFAAKGGLAGIPMTLSRIMRKISTPGEDGKRKRVPCWLLHLEPTIEWVRHMYAIATRTPGGMLPGSGPGGGGAALPAPVDPGTGEVIEGVVVEHAAAGANGWTDRVNGCQSVKQLADWMITDIAAIQPDAYRANVQQLAYKRITELIAHAAPTMSNAAAKTASGILGSIPMETDGWNAATDAVLHRRMELETAGQVAA